MVKKVYDVLKVEPQLKSRDTSPYRYALSVTSQFYFCGVPLRYDTAPKCDLNCLYCYAMARGGRRTSRDLLADVCALGRLLHRAKHTDKLNIDINTEMIRHGVPVHFGGMSDPFSNERTTQLSLKALAHFSAFGHPVLLSTKNTSVLTAPNTLHLLRRMRKIAVQVSFSSPFTQQARKIEPHAPSVPQRIDGIRKLTLEGIPVIVRLQPVLSEWVPRLSEYLIPELGKVGALHATIEFMKLPVEKNKCRLDELAQALGHDILGEYRRLGAYISGREWILPTQYKWERCRELVRAIRLSGMTFSTPDYGLYHLSETACCCGIDSIAGFGHWFKGNIPAIVRSQPDGVVSFPAHHEPWFPQQSVRMYMNSHCRSNNKNSMCDFLLQKWNAPGTTNAPDSLLGVSWHGNYDSYGNCLYHKERP